MQGSIEIGIMMLDHARELGAPRYQSGGAAGADLCAALPPEARLELAPLGRALVPCGFSLALPEGYEAQIRPRSGLALRHGITVLNTPGTIDRDFRGEVQVLLVNLGSEPFSIGRGDRIAQIVFAPVGQASFTLKEALDETDRGTGGFGSTGRV